MTNMARYLLMAAVILGCAAASQAQPTVTEERWSVVLLQGQPAGHNVTRIVEDADRIVTETHLEIAVGRTGQTIHIATDSSFTETADGRPIEAQTTMDMGLMKMTTHVRFEDDKLVKTITQAGQRRTVTLDAPDALWMTPMEVARYTEAKLAAGDPNFSYTMFNHAQTFDLETVSARVIGDETIDVFGRTVPATHLNVRMSSQPALELDVWVDAEGNELKSAVDMGGIQLQMVAADKQLALAKKAPPELLADTLIHLDQPIANPRQLTRATYRLSVDEGELPDPPESTAQDVRRIDKRTVEITIDTQAAPANPAGPPPKLIHSAMADGRDEKVIALARRAVEGAGDARRDRAEAMRRFVYDYVNDKHLGVGMATAGEVARTRQGDCTEHAVLLVAMLRAAGIPSRMASGVAYVQMNGQPLFGYHAWAQAWLDGQWVDLDAALSPDEAFDATHMLLSTSDLADGTWANDLVQMATTIGRLRIDPAPGNPGN